MTDYRLRRLEREAKDDPGARERLEAEWIRAGLGWHGERLPDNDVGYVTTHGCERGVYKWFGPDKEDGTCAIVVESVYVPGGEVECEACRGSGWESWHDLNGAQRDGCGACFGRGETPGYITISPFYVGRYPATNLEWTTFADTTDYDDSEHGHGEVRLREQQPLHPVVNVTHADAIAFCSWAGLRLPSAAEWKWAALGAKKECVKCDGSGMDLTYKHERDSRECYACDGEGERHDKHPWGNEELTHERCVWAGRLVHAGVTPAYASTQPVVDCRHCIEGTCYMPNIHAQGMRDELIPARDAGKSWRGAHDMAGNVWEWTAERSVLGGSFRTPTENQGDGRSGLARALVMPADAAPTHLDDVGFRVALSAI